MLTVYLCILYRYLSCFLKIFSLHKEIKDFYAYISATPEERGVRLDVYNRLTNVIKSKWPESTVEVFGSFATGLYLPNG